MPAHLNHALPLQRAANILRLLALLCALPLTSAVNATTVQRVDVDYLLEQARFIFEGEVIARESNWHPNGRSIYTLVTFRVLDVIKGDYLQPTIAIRYAGGVIGDKGMAVSAMVYPRLGEQGIYFMENPQRHLANPMVGWSQGHFIIERDEAATQRIFTENALPVLAIEAAAQNNQPTVAGVEFSHGVARGLRLGSKATKKSRAMDKSAFKQALQQRLIETKNATENKIN